MIIRLTEQEKELLLKEHIEFSEDGNYTEDAALRLLDAVRDAEVEYAQGEDSESRRLYNQYADLGDKLFSMIP